MRKNSCSKKLNIKIGIKSVEVTDGCQKNTKQCSGFKLQTLALLGWYF